MRHHKIQTGFTLVEIMLSIGIIAILVAIILSGMMWARNKGYQTTCLSAGKQIALVMQMYIQDNDSTYPPRYEYANWLQKTYPHPEKAPHCGAFTDAEAEEHLPFMGLSINLNLLGYQSVRIQKLSVPQVSDSALTNPARTVLYADSYIDIPFASELDPFGGNPPSPYKILPKPFRRHSGGANLVFTDGHAKWSKPENVESLRDDPNKTNRPTYAVRW